MKNAKQGERIGSISAVEVIFFQAEAEGDTRHQVVADLRERRYVLQDGLPKSRQPDREKVATVHGQPGLYARILFLQLGAEIEAFLEVGLARGEFFPHREIAAPGPAAACHPDFHLLVER